MMSENRKNVIPLLIAFLAGVAAAAIVAFLLIGNRGVNTKQEKRTVKQEGQTAKQEEQTAKQETDAPEVAQKETDASDAAQQEAGAAESTTQTAASQYGTTEGAQQEAATSRNIDYASHDFPFMESGQPVAS